MTIVKEITLKGDAIATVRHQADLIHRANWKREVDEQRYPLDRLRMGAAGEWAFAEWLAERSTLSFAGPLPYSGQGRYSPEDFILNPGRVRIDLHTRHPNYPLTYPAKRWKQSRPYWLVAALLEPEPESVEWDAPNWNPTAIRGDLHGSQQRNSAPGDQGR